MTSPNNPDQNPFGEQAHYAHAEIEPIDVIETFGLNYRLGNVTKYVLRAGRKAYPGSTPLQSRLSDLQKAHWFLGREIRMLEKHIENENQKTGTENENQNGRSGAAR